MSDSVTESAPLSGPTVQTIGGAVLALALAVSLAAFSTGDFVTGGAVLLYIPVGIILFLTGRKDELV
ncbi:hypothetical protein [Halodesulfurarchaeum sp.]